MRATTAFLLTAILALPGLAVAQNCTANAGQVVSAIYRQVLQRTPNGGEASTWVNQLSGGQTTVRELVQTIASSAEHRQRFMNGTSDGDRRNDRHVHHRWRRSL